MFESPLRLGKADDALLSEIWGRDIYDEPDFSKLEGRSFRQIHHFLSLYGFLKYQVTPRSMEKARGKMKEFRNGDELIGISHEEYAALLCKEAVHFEREYKERMLRRMGDR